MKPRLLNWKLYILTTELTLLFTVVHISPQHFQPTASIVIGIFNRLFHARDNGKSQVYTGHVGLIAVLMK